MELVWALVCQYLQLSFLFSAESCLRST